MQKLSARFPFFQNSWTQKIGTRFSASADFVYPIMRFDFWRKWHKSAFARSKNQGFMRFLGSH